MAEVLKIKQLAEKYNLTTRTIRFWEEKGLLQPVFRTSGKRRVYEQNVEDTIKEIMQYKNRGLILDEIKDIMAKKRKSSKQKKIPIRILVDSTAGLTKSYLKSNPELDVIPLYVNIGKKLYMDNVNITEDDFYSRLETLSKDMAISTSPPSVDDFFEAYSNLVRDGAETIYSLHISSIFSKTYENAKKAADQFLGVDIRVFDVKTSGQSIGLITALLLEKIKEGCNVDDCQKEVEKLIEKSWLNVTFTSLKTLATLGLLNMNIDTAFKGIFDKLLNFRPVLSTEDGNADFVISAREDTLEDAIKTMETALQNKIKASKLKLKMLAVTHSQLDDLAGEVKARLESEYKVPVMMQEGSVVLCTHLGPTSLGLNAVFG